MKINIGAGIQFRSGLARDVYAAGGVRPEFVAAFSDGVYRVDSAASTFADAFTFARTGTATFVDADGILQTAADGVARTGHHIWNGSEWAGPFLQLESEARTNLLHTTNALVTQSTTVTAVPHTLHFTGTGTITLSGASTAGPLVGTGTGENNRVSLTFTPSAASLTLTVTGTVTNAQLEVGLTPSSYIPNTAGSGTATRNAETLTIASADAPWPEPVVIGPELVTNGTFDTDLSGWTLGSDPAQVVATWDAGRVSIARGGGGNAGFSQIFSTPLPIGVYLVEFDLVSSTSGGVAVSLGGTNSVLSGVGSKSLILARATTSSFLQFWPAGLNQTVVIDNVSVKEINPLSVSIQMEGTMTGDASTFLNWELDASNLVTLSAGASTYTFTQEASGTVDTVTGGSFTSGVNVPFSIASRHGTTFINGAVDGTALTANLTPTALPDLSATDVQIGPDFMGSIGRIVIWADDIGDAGIAAASA